MLSVVRLMWLRCAATTSSVITNAHGQNGWRYGIFIGTPGGDLPMPGAVPNLPDHRSNFPRLAGFGTASVSAISGTKGGLRILSNTCRRAMFLRWADSGHRRVSMFLSARGRNCATEETVGTCCWLVES